MSVVSGTIYSYVESNMNSIIQSSEHVKTSMTLISFKSDPPKLSKLCQYYLCFNVLIFI